MAQLTGNPIQSSYLGLLKTSDNAALQANGFNAITDGAGNGSMIKMSQTELQLGSNISTQYFKQFAAGGGSTEIKDVGIRLDDATASQYLVVDANNAGVGAGSNYIVTNPTTNTIAGPLDLSGATVSGLDGLAPTGGTSGQVLTKTTGTDYDYGWAAGGGGGGIVSFRGTNWSTSTHVANDLVYSTFTIPGGSFTTGDVIEMNDIEYRDGLNNWGYSSIWISDTAQTVGQAPASGNNFSMGQAQSPNSRKSIYYSRKMYINSSGTFLMPYGSSNDVNAEQSSDPSVTYNINWANDQYIYYQLWSDSTTGSYSTAGTLIRKIN